MIGHTWEIPKLLKTVVLCKVSHHSIVLLINIFSIILFIISFFIFHYVFDQYSSSQSINPIMASILQKRIQPRTPFCASRISFNISFCVFPSLSLCTSSCVFISLLFKQSLASSRRTFHYDGCFLNGVC